MSDTSIFNSDDKTENKAAELEVSLNTENKAEDTSLDVQAISKRLDDSQKFIETLKKENAELREVAAKAKTIDELLGELKAQSNNNIQSAEPTSAEDMFSKVEQLVNNKLTEKEIEGRRQELMRQLRDNGTKVANALQNIYGDKAEEMFSLKAKEMGLSVTELDNLAREKPSVVLEVFKVNSTVTGASSASSGRINTTNLGKSKTYQDDPAYKEMALKGDVAGLMDLYNKYQ